MQIILPLGHSPILSYPNYGSIFSVIDVKTKEYLPWIYNHFVQLMLPINHKAGMRLDYSIPHLLKSIPWIELSQIDRDIVFDKWGNTVNFLKYFIERGKYIYALYDVSYIKSYGRKSSSLHDPLIYGYNDEENVFYFADNYKEGKYSFGIITYDEIEKATEAVSKIEMADWFPGFYLFKYRTLYDYGSCRFLDHYTYKFNMQLYKELLRDYLNQNETTLRWSTSSFLINNEENSINNVWGIGIYSYIVEHLKMVKCGDAYNDIRCFAVLYEHKIIMDETIKYIKNSLNITIDSKIGDLMIENITAANTALNLSIKQIITNNSTAIIDKLINKVLLIEENDLKIVNALLTII